MLKDIFLFEIVYRLKRPASYLYFLILFIMVFFAIASDQVTIGDQTGNMLRNSSLVIFRITSIMSAFGIIIMSAIMSPPVLKDFEHDTWNFLYAYPLNKFSYLAGRFLGSYMYALFVFSAIPLGILAGSFFADYFGWFPHEKFAAFNIGSYFKPFVIVILPNALFSGAIFFTLSTLSRKIIYSYLGNVLLLVLYVWGMSQLSELDNRFIAALADPFGIIPLMDVTRYWTPADVNTLQVPVNASFLLNRLIWTTVGLIMLAIVYFRFRFSVQASLNKTTKKTILSETTEKRKFLKLTSPKIEFSTIQALKNSISLGWLDFTNVLKSIAFIGIVFAGLLLMLSNVVNTGNYMGTNTFPVTYQLLESTGGNFSLIILIIITFYAGELVWQEKKLRIDSITDPLPVQNWVYSSSKIFGMFLILSFLLIVLMIFCLLSQVFMGFFSFNFSLYFTELFTIQLPNYFFISLLALLVQTIIPNKLSGHFVMVVYYIIVFVAMPQMNLEHYLYRFPQTPGSPYSDMNGFGHFLQAVRWFQVYWGFAAILIALIINILWRRGNEDSFKSRFRSAASNLSKPIKVALAVSLAGFVLTGGYIFYNTNILNKFYNSKTLEKLQADFEKKYKKYEKIAQPRIVAVNVNVDIFPYERNFSAKGSYILKNNTRKSIDSIHISINNDMIIRSFEIGSASEIIYSDKIFGYYILKLPKPVIPGDSVEFTFNIEYISKGFKNNRNETTIAYNGTFINNQQFFPRIGYQYDSELSDKDDRKKYGLPPKARMPDVNDLEARKNTYLGTDADWVRFEATVSTVSDQVALAPGYCIKEWTENGRKYSHFKMDSRILNFWSFLSARYEIKKDKWKDVNLELYYQKGHEYNIDKMFKSMKNSLSYYTSNFSPYQYKQLRIIEFPRYSSFAQSFPNTIPFSEGIGFIANLKDPEDIDYVYYVTAHEIAHQWWAHQVIGGNVQGATLMSESFSQYSALMVMEKEYGKDQMTKFLKYELDQYLRGRMTEPEKERPIMLCENQQYIHYAKGSLVMYALRDYMGEDSLNKVLARYIRKTALQPPPFTNSIEFLNELRPSLPDSLKYLIKDLFETITVFSNTAKEFSYRKLSSNAYEVTLQTESHKFRADSLGFETEIPLNDYIDIGIFGKEIKNGKKHEKVLYMQKHKISKCRNTFKIIVKAEPEKGGIDPYNKLIDRVSDDNKKGL